MERTLSNMTMLHAWWRVQEVGKMALGFNYEHEERNRYVSLQGFRSCLFLKHPSKDAKMKKKEGRWRDWTNGRKGGELDEGREQGRIEGDIELRSG